VILDDGEVKPSARARDAASAATALAESSLKFVAQSVIFRRRPHTN
jgi:hypothetical protein